MKYYLILLLFFTSFISFSQEEFIKHTVKQGETVYSIAKKYLVTESDIYALNPEVKEGLKFDTVLIIPINSKVKNTSTTEEIKQLSGFKTHKVKRRETLQSIAVKYNITEDIIKKENPSLYSANLRRGDRIKIPQYATKIVEKELKNTLKTYEVQPKEGKWRVAYRFGITVQELDALNPKMNEVLQPGDLLNVPNIEDEQEKEVENSFRYYTVVKSEGFYSLEKKLGYTKQELENLNPELKIDGLKYGMVLKLPRNETVIDSTSSDTLKIDLSKSIFNLSRKKIALLLPYRLNKLDKNDDETLKNVMKSSILSELLEFHIGVEMAVDSAKQLGISTDLKVFDSKNNEQHILNLLNSNNFENYDAIIGPLNSDGFDHFAKQLENSDVAIFSPFRSPKKMYRNVFKVSNDKNSISKSIVSYIKKDSTLSNIVIIADRKNIDVVKNLKLDFPNAKVIYSQKDKKTGKDNNFIYEANLKKLISNGNNIVFLESSNSSMIESVTSLLNGFNDKKRQITLVTTNKNKGFDVANNQHLANLNFHFPSINKEISFDTNNGFVQKYKDKYGILPSSYTIKGFDLTLDILLRLANSQHILYSDLNQTVTEHLEYKFDYQPNGNSQGYINRTSYILKYNGLSIETVKQ